MRKLVLPLVLVVWVTLGSGCTSNDHGEQPTASTVPATCTPKPVVGDGTLAGGSYDGTAVAALVERKETGPLRVGEQVKFIVRMTGEGDLAVSVVEPDGSETETDWGPDAHGASTFGGPGEEWGFGMAFSAAGCWTIVLRRSESGSGYLQFEVV